MQYSVIRQRRVLCMSLLRKFRPPYALSTNVPRDTSGYAGKSYLKLRYQLHGKSVPNGLQVWPVLGPLGLFVFGKMFISYIFYTVLQSDGCSLYVYVGLA